MLTPAQVTRRAKQLLSKEGRWTTGYEALDEHGAQVDPTDPHARTFCAIGAVYHICGVSNEMRRNKTLGKLVVDKDMQRVLLAEKVIAALGQKAATLTEAEAWDEYPCECENEVAEGNLTRDDLDRGYTCQNCEDRWVAYDIVDLNDSGKYEMTLDAFEEAYQDFLRAKIAKAS